MSSGTSRTTMVVWGIHVEVWPGWDTAVSVVTKLVHVETVLTWCQTLDLSTDGDRAAWWGLFEVDGARYTSFTFKNTDSVKTHDWVCRGCFIKDQEENMQSDGTW